MHMLFREFTRSRRKRFRPKSPKLTRRNRTASLGFETLEARLVLTGTALFPAATTPRLDLNAQEAVIADFNNDGIMDIAGLSSLLSVSLGMGNGDFAEAEYSYLGSGNYDRRSLVAVDLDTDGALDLALLDNNTSAVLWLRNNGLGQFADPESIDVSGLAYNIQQLAALDQNADGRMDLLLGGEGLSVLVLNQGNGVFEAQEHFVVENLEENYYRPILPIDLQGEGPVDVLEIDGLSLIVHWSDGSGGYVTSGPYPTPYDVRSAQTADIDGDGHLDLVLNTAGHVVIYRGLPDHQLAEPVALNPADYERVVLLDINSDGRTEVLASNHGYFSVYHFQESGNFRIGESYRAQVSNSSSVGAGVAIASGDVNGDGLPDVVIANGFSLTYVSGTPDGRFAAEPVFSNGQSMDAPLMEDLNGDGLVDLVAVGTTLDVFFGPHGDAFTLGASYALPTWVAETQLIDVNNDDQLDVLHFGPQNIGIRLNLGTGALGELEEVPFSSPQAVVFADLDRDGKLDAAGLNQAQQKVVVHWDVTSVVPGTATEVELSFVPRSLQLLNSNADQFLDLLVLSDSSNEFAVARNRGDRSFAFPVNVSHPHAMSSAHLGDFNGDGRDDLLLAHSDVLSFAVYVASDAGYEQLSLYEDLNPGIAEVRIADLNLDGRDDVVINPYESLSLYFRSNALLVYLSDVAGLLSMPAVHTNATSDIYRFELADMDADGLLDLVDNDYTIRRNLGDGTFGLPASYRVDSQPSYGDGWGLRIHDFNGDGTPDIFDGISGGFSTMAGLITWNRGNGDLAARRVLQASQRFGGAPELADLNGDGQLDFIAQVYAGLEPVSGIYQPDETYTISSHLLSQRVRKRHLTDLDRDGALDLILITDNYTTSPRRIDVLPGNGDGSFGEVQSYSFSTTVRDFAVVDYNADGHEDVLVLVQATGGQFQLAIYLNDQQGGLTLETNHLLSGFATKLAVADLNADSRFDIATLNSNQTVSIFRATVDGSFLTPQTYAIEAGASEFQIADLDSDGRMDLVVSYEEHPRYEASIFWNGVDGSLNHQFVTRSAHGHLWRTHLDDVNGDGQPDVVTELSNVLVVRTNLGGRQFARPQFHDLGPGFGTDLGDFDGNGSLDVYVLFSNSSGVDGVQILQNLFEAPDPVRPNLVVSDITLPPLPLDLGHTLTVEYQVTNAGLATAAAGRVDTIYLSRDAQIDPADRILGRVVSRDPLANSESAAHEFSVSFWNHPEVLSGEWQILVKADANNRILETDEQDNVLAEALSVNANVTSLNIGNAFAGTIAHASAQYFQFVADSSEGLSILLSNLPTDGLVDLYISRERLPSPDNHDWFSSFPFTDQQRVWIPSPVPTTYYVMVRARSLAESEANFSLLVSKPDFGVSTAYFGRGGDVGDYTFRMEGDRLTRSLQVAIERDGQAFEAKSYYHVSETVMYVTFDLAGLPHGTYDVVVSNGEAETRIPNGLEVIAGVTETGLHLNGVVPAALARNRWFNFTIEWKNTSLNDIPSPLLTLGTSLSHYDSKEYPLGTHHTFLGVSTTDGPPGIILPGQREFRVFRSKTGNEPGEFQFTLLDEIGEGNRVFDWAEEVERVRPSAMTADEVSAIAALLEQQYGGTYAGYHAMLGTSANVTWDDPENVWELSQAEVLRLWGQLPGGVWGTVESAIIVPPLGFQLLATEVSTGQLYFAHTDKQGRFAFSGLPEGTFEISVDGYMLTSGNAIVEVSAGIPNDPVVLQVAPLSTFALRIYLRENQPLSYFTVGLIDAGGNVVSNSFTGNDGIVSLPMVAPGEYTLYATDGNLMYRRSMTLNPEVDVVSEIILTSVALTGTVPADSTLAPILISETAPTTIYAPELSGNEFTLLAPEGTYRLVLFDYASVTGHDLEELTLQTGESRELGMLTVPLAGPNGEHGEWHSVNDPGYAEHIHGERHIVALASAWIYGNNLQLLRINEVDPMVEFVHFAVGREYQSFVRRFVSGQGGYASLDERSSLVDGWAIRNRGFKGHETTYYWAHQFLESYAPFIRMYLEQDESKLCKPNSPAKSKALRVPIEDIPTYPDDKYFLQFAGTLWYREHTGDMEAVSPLGHMGYELTIAGGVGAYGNPLSPSSLRPDARSIIEGDFLIELNADGQVTVKLDAQFNVHDAFDFFPGHLGLPIFSNRYFDLVEDNAQNNLTTLLAHIEINGLTTDLPFDATWKEKPAVSISFKTPVPEESQASCNDNDDDSDNQGRWRGGSPVIASSDPNDIVGPQGVGPGNFVVADSILPYTINFENDPVLATAPAQFVEVRQVLDSDLDLSTFRLGDIGFGDFVVDVPNDVMAFETRVDLTDSHGIWLDVSASLYVNTREVIWTFTSLDPATGDLPEDPRIGFLPPNTTAPTGQGYVSYTVFAKPALADGTRIDAEATIVFDDNAPLITPPIFNSLDQNSPTAQMRPLPEELPAGKVLLEWSGSDGEGVGIAHYDIFVAIDGGPVQSLATQATATSLLFDGEAGRTYEFFSIATDLLGFQEASGGPAELVVAFSACEFIPKQNARNAYDVSNDKAVTPLDAVLIINALNVGLSPTTCYAPVWYPDVNPDGVVTVLDAVLVINYLNSGGSFSAEGEAELAWWQSQDDSSSLDATHLPVTNSLSDWLDEFAASIAEQAELVYYDWATGRPTSTATNTRRDQTEDLWDAILLDLF